MIRANGEVRRELAKAALVATVTVIATTVTTIAIDSLKAAFARKKSGGSDAQS